MTTLRTFDSRQRKVTRIYQFLLGFLTSRTVTQSCNINGVPFEKGMAVFIPIYTLHHDEQYWHDPEAFKPERFLPENKESITPYTYLPFGSGPRGCIGMRFAWMEMKMVVVRMMEGGFGISRVAGLANFGHRVSGFP
ncbi:MAG: cytochrome P450 [Planctomycetaceae bacterium]|nr:cytochrome P450 [Planctomycetaceae bacterium]